MTNSLSNVASRIVLFTGLAFFAACKPSTRSSLQLHSLFNDNAVLQRNVPIPVYGTAQPAATVTVALNGQSKNGKADSSGRWMIKLDPEQAGGPYDLEVRSGKEKRVVHNILVGEVWLCSGQSNMDMKLQGTDRAELVIHEADHPLLRYFKIPWRISFEPLDFLEAEWQVCSPSNAGDLSAVAYYFARELMDSLQVPVGVIIASYSASNVETFTSLESFATLKDYKDLKPLGLDFPEYYQKRCKQVVEDSLKAHGAAPPFFGNPGDGWQQATFDDSNWAKVDCPGKLERYFPKMDGQFYFRKRFSLPDGLANSGAVVHFQADDNDVAWVNGKEIGTSSGFLVKRAYPVEAAILRKADNILAISVEDTGQSGGLTGSPEDLVITGAANYSLPMSGDWSVFITEPKFNYEITQNDYPGLIFNAMIHPLTRYAIKGVTWYQGESNITTAEQYKTTFPLLIRDWRRQWGQDSLPFHFIQLSAYGRNGENSNVGSDWAELREAQAAALSLPNTTMTVTIDLGEIDNIHPTNKADVGKRLAANVLYQTYHKKMPHACPRYSRMEVSGGKTTVYFTNIGSGLVCHGGAGKAGGFEVAGADRIFYVAEANVEEDKVVIFSDKVSDPVSVRYAWANFPAGPLNLYNKEGFPAEPFRTDNWPGITAGKPYMPKFSRAD
ncbi:MAG: beta galactosidase jelly roll domain-containing protein [Lewinellaceae bacterium]|nr:beta galactosidase jelly roll domain-containing protein [Saprospiraceae bacterium]MCB9340253.1 beta galactosidase jelly roll domain-containing protein [Lewinellaceae bacterium]